jgi:hypothetical protein
MPSPAPEEDRISRLRTQRNLFTILAVCSVSSIGLALPRKVTHYRELKAANARLVGLQEAIVVNRQRIQAAQEQILQVQGKIAKQQAQ